MKFQAYRYNKEPFFIANDEFRRHIENLRQKIELGVYKLIDNPCLCCNEDKNDILISEKDMWGLPNPNYLCIKCGLIRSSKILETNSLIEFYTNDYNKIYYASDLPNEALFNSQRERGRQFKNLTDKYIKSESIKYVFEVGCSLGGILYEYSMPGRKLFGCEYDDSFIKFGKQKGIEISRGGISDSAITINSQDLIILSHVLEHFVNPIREIQNVIEYVKPGKYLLVEVPGIYADKPYKYYPNWHFQFSHVINFFNEKYLRVFFQTLGLEILYGDERCTFLLKKPQGYIAKPVNCVTDDSLKGDYIRIVNYLNKRKLFLDTIPLNEIKLKKAILKLLKILKIK